MKLKKEVKTERNSPCPCGSGKKYKKCCLKKEQEQIRQQIEIRRITENVCKQKGTQSKNEKKEIVSESVEESQPAEEGNDKEK